MGLHRGALRPRWGNRIGPRSQRGGAQRSQQVTIRVQRKLCQRRFVLEAGDPARGRARGQRKHVLRRQSHRHAQGIRTLGQMGAHAASLPRARRPGAGRARPQAAAGRGRSAHHRSPPEARDHHPDLLKHLRRSIVVGLCNHRHRHAARHAHPRAARRQSHPHRSRQRSSLLLPGDRRTRPQPCAGPAARTRLLREELRASAGARPGSQPLHPRHGVRHTSADDRHTRLPRQRHAAERVRTRRRIRRLAARGAGAERGARPGAARVPGHLRHVELQLALAERRVHARQRSLRRSEQHEQPPRRMDGHDLRTCSLGCVRRRALDRAARRRDAAERAGRPARLHPRRGTPRWRPRSAREAARGAATRISTTRSPDCPTER